MSRILFLILISAAAMAGLNLSGPDRLLPATSPIWTPTPTVTATRVIEVPTGIPGKNTGAATPTPAPTLPAQPEPGCKNCSR